jgi:large subunit ribosomal protein L9
MKLILKQDVEHLGRTGDLVDVADGYARNFLLPRKKGVFASTRNVAEFEHQKRLIAIQMKKERTAAEVSAARLSAAVVRISVQVGEQEKMFGSVTPRDIVEALAAQGIEVDRKQILLDKPIKEIGTSSVSVKIHHDLIAQLKVEVTAAEAVLVPATSAEQASALSAEETSTPN